MAFLDINKISKSFSKDSYAVKEFDLHVEKGEFVSFLGPSGCGKTTTLRIVAGFEIPTGGSVIMNGEDITNRFPNQRNVGMVFQAYALFPNLTVAENIGFGLMIAKRPKAEIKKTVEEMLNLIHMTDYGNRYPFQLSGGQQQRVSLARALAIHPQVLLLDEPLSALDAKIRVVLRAEIRAIQRQLGITAIYVTHDQEEALSISDRVVVMNTGLIEQVGPPFEIYNYPRTEFVAQFVGILNSLSAQVVEASTGRMILDGQEIVAGHPLNGARQGDTVMIALRPEGLSFQSDMKKANNLKCIVETITFLGSVVRVSLRLGEAMINMDTFNNPYLELPKIGDTVQIACSAEAVLVLDEKTGATL
jgi:putative spermidine/putrescine transport system ATP-binding protein